MPIFLAAFIGYLRFVIGQGRKLTWVKGSLSYSMVYKKRKHLNKKRELPYQLTRQFDFWRVPDPLPDASCMAGENWFEGRDCPLTFSFPHLTEVRVSHFVPRPQ